MGLYNLDGRTWSSSRLKPISTLSCWVLLLLLRRAIERGEVIFDFDFNFDSRVFTTAMLVEINVQLNTQVPEKCNLGIFQTSSKWIQWRPEAKSQTVCTSLSTATSSTRCILPVLIQWCALVISEVDWFDQNSVPIMFIFSRRRNKFSPISSIIDAFSWFVIIFFTVSTCPMYDRAV